MPRKKLDSKPVDAELAPKVKTTARATRKPKSEPVVEAPVAPPAIGEAKPPRARKQAAQAEPTAPPVIVVPASEASAKPKGVRKQKPAELPTAVEQPERTPKIKGRQAKPSAAKAEPTVTYIDFPDEFGAISVLFRPRAVAAKAATPPAPSKAKAQTSKLVTVALDGDDEGLVIEWRTRGAAPETSATKADQRTGAEGPESGDEELGQRRSRRRRRREPEPVDSVAESGITMSPDEPEPASVPVVVKKPPIAIPENAPQVIERGGVPAIVRDHRVYPPIMFFGNPADERRATTVFDELRMACEAGVHLHSFLIELPVAEDQVESAAAFAAYILAKSVDIDPESQVIFRIEFQAPRGWEQRFTNATYNNAHGDPAEPSVCDDEFWGVAEDCLALFVKKVRLLDQKDHVLGVHLERGEWFLPEGYGYDTSKAATHKFREWARHRYLNDEVTLRASWFDGSVRFDSIQVPSFHAEGGEGEKFIRSSRKQRRYVDYHLFLSDETAHRIGELAYAAKAAAEGMLLVGVSYGYTFEWSHPGSGHLALGKLLRMEEIDFIGGPPSYRNREPGGTAPFPCPIDSFALNGKLYISEEDFKTSLSVGHEPDDFNPSLKTPQSLESVHWRGAGAALAHASGVEWMDLWGNGWLRTHSVWERAARVRETLIDRMEAPLGDPDVAVFIDERALAYLVDSNAFALLVQNVRESVLRAGVSAAFYLLSDLAHREKFPESRLYLFLNAWDIRPELRAAIKNRLQRDNKVLFWLYSAGLFDAGRDSLERAREVTGIALKPQPFYSRAGTTILNRRHPLSEAFPDRSLIGGTKLEPSYFAIPEEGVVLGEYTQTGLPSFVVKEFREDPTAPWTSVFLGEPLVNPALIRALAQMAGAHIWNYHEDVVHVRAPFLTVHCSGTGPRTITLPTKCSAYNLLTQDWAAVDSTNLRFVAIDGSTHMFLVGPRVDIEHFMQANPQDVLHVEDLPKRDTNVRVDTSNFDVPIMKLDEWMEGGDQDDVADEWFLRPQQLIDESDLEPAQAAESPEQVGRRRRRRRRGGRGGDNDRGPLGEVVVARAESGGGPGEEEFTMSVTFRKRE